MPSLHGWISLVLLAAVLATILIRPRQINEALPALIGACLAIGLQLMPVNQIPTILHRTADVLLFLASMMVLTVIIEDAGVFERIAEWTAGQARGSGPLLVVLVFLLGAGITALMSLDVTVIVLTPIVFLLTTRRNLPPLPFLFICTFVANTASLIFPMSNLTNLLVYASLDLDFASFVAHMWLPNLAALVTNMLVFAWLFRHEIPAHFEVQPALERSRPADAWHRFNAVVLTLTLLSLIILGLLHRPLSVGSLTGATVLMIVGFGTGRLARARIRHDVAWPVLLFVIAMLVVVETVNRQWLSSLTWRYPDSTLGTLIAATGIAALGSNIVNNVPMALLAVPFIERTAPAHRDLAAYGTVLGANIGPTLTTYGSLATLLWLSLCRKRGLMVATGTYLRVALVTGPAILLSSTAALWLADRFLT